MPEILTFEAEIRDANDHTSDAMAADPDVTVTTDTLHPNSFEEYNSVRVYVDDTHGTGFDISLEHCAHDDDDWSASISEATYSLAGGQDQTSWTLTGPVGQIRIYFHAGVLTTALSTGRTRVTVYLQK